VLLSAALLAGCGSTTPSASSPVTGSPAAASAPPPSDIPSASLPASAGPAESSAPSGPPAPAGFTTPAPPDVAATWSGLAWRRLPADDALAGVRSMLHWSGGFLAVGDAVGAGDTSSTPVWRSSDGATWQGVSAPFGPSALVIGMGELGSSLVVLTLQGGPNACSGDTELSCWTPSGPLAAWRSSDGATWTHGPGPDFSLVPECGTCGVDIPVVAFGAPGVFVVASSPDGLQAALSPDGATWQPLASGALPSTFAPSDVEAAGDGFVAVGELDGDVSRAAAFGSADGLAWRRLHVPDPDSGSNTGTTVSRLFVGSGGMLATGSETDTPGRELWWTSPDGRDWTAVAKYKPLGVWHGEDQGSGLMSDGNILADGTRLLAFRVDGGAAGWTSPDGRAWRALDVTGIGSDVSRTGAGDWPILDLRLLPVGVLWRADDGTTWFGEPRT
jgi:hypothetical protein